MANEKKVIIGFIPGQKKAKKEITDVKKPQKEVKALTKQVEELTNKEENTEE